MNNNQSGLSLIEVLITNLIFSIIILGLVNFQSELVTSLQQAKNYHLAQMHSFKLLERYPNIKSVDLPNGWQYQITTKQYDQHCKIVFVTIKPNKGNEAIQQRWFCH